MAAGARRHPDGGAVVAGLIALGNDLDGRYLVMIVPLLLWRRLPSGWRT
ncbi:MAG: hypothetical protein U0521_21325 [Anaerolineae bacterium]